MQNITIEKQWKLFSSQIRCHGGEKNQVLQTLKLAYYSGAIAYRNIVAEINNAENVEACRSMAEKLLLNAEKELTEFSGFVGKG